MLTPRPRTDQLLTPDGCASRPSGCSRVELGAHGDRSTFTNLLALEGLDTLARSPALFRVHADAGARAQEESAARPRDLVFTRRRLAHRVRERDLRERGALGLLRRVVAERCDGLGEVGGDEAHRAARARGRAGGARWSERDVSTKRGLFRAHATALSARISRSRRRRTRGAQPAIGADDGAAAVDSRSRRDVRLPQADGLGGALARNASTRWARGEINPRHGARHHRRARRGARTTARKRLSTMLAQLPALGRACYSRSTAAGVDRLATSSIARPSARSSRRFRYQRRTLARDAPPRRDHQRRVPHRARAELKAA